MSPATTTTISQEKCKQAMTAVKPNAKQVTPSWTSIVAAYHAEGNGDREMLLALLHAKAKEDERLAAMDLLKAEQMRAYATHIAMHGPLYPQASPTSVPYTHRPAPPASSKVTTVPSTHSSERSRAPSLTNSVSSRTSSNASPIESAASFEDEQRIVMTAKQHQAYNTLPPLKRKRSSISEADVITVEAPRKRSSPIVGSRRTSPTLSLPGPASLMAAAALSPPLSKSNQPTLQHILNSELRPSLSNTRMMTSDVRSSSSSDEE